MAIKLSPDEIAVIRAHKKELQTGDLAWIQTDKEHALDENQKGNVRAFMYEKGVNIFKKMTSIPTKFFGKVSLDTVIIPDTILELSESAFEGSNIKSIILEEGVETIGVNAFANSNISDIELPDTIKTIKENPEDIATVSGMTITKARRMHDKILENEYNQELILKLNGYGFSVREAIDLITISTIITPVL